MVMKSSRYFLLGFLFIAGILFSLNFVVADFTDCWAYSSENGGSKTTCNVAQCLWASNNSEDVVANITDVYDPFCNFGGNCCFPNDCWQFNGNQTSCEAGITSLGVLNCTWDSFMTILDSNGSVVSEGGCANDWFNSGDSVMMSDGCWNYDGDQASCMGGANAAKCSWSANDANQNTWCGIQSLTDAQGKNSLATSDDIGCCKQQGCWNHDGNQTNCEGGFNGNCFYDTSSGWCNTKWCGEITDEENCTYVNQNLYMPCEWNVSAGLCEDSYGDGGFGFFNTTDSCFDAGGWYNSTGDCVMPSGGIDFGGGGGGFLFGGSATCWFADNQENVCGNVTGCVYCIAGNGVNGVGNSSNNICYNKQVGFCEGHDVWDTGSYVNANNSASLACVDIEIKSACKYGPLPNCKWTNSSTSVGAGYCIVGTSSEKKTEPPVPFCEHPDSKNNYTVCSQLIEEFMMPCTWDNTSAVVKNCTFNSGAVFGSGGETDVGEIGSETSCTASGGTWQTEYYLENDILKQDSWCEMTGFFDIDDGGQEANKANCDTSCWACEFQGNGSAWANVADAEDACVSSALGYCDWTNDTTDGQTAAFNGLGWCDYPEEMESGGASDCDSNCENCDFMNEPESACGTSVLDCKWVNDSVGGFCVDASKKICDNDCFSCYSSDDCYDSESDVSCEWDTDFALCKPASYSGEICFNGFDDDSDGMVDCGDPDCGFDNFCGGSAFGGDCFSQEDEGNCNQTFAFVLGGENLNCTWVVNDWETLGHCDMPGSNCWQYDGNLSACGEISGCTNESSFSGGMCDINVTLMDSSNCMVYNGNETGCNLNNNCQYQNDNWVNNNLSETEPSGWCDFKPFATCMGLNESSCGALPNNCTWQVDSYSAMPGGEDGWCDVACFNPDLNESSCGGFNGLCEYRNMSDTCQPEMFIMMGMGEGGKTGCWQYNGNETGCGLNDVTCQYKNDSYANNNLTGEPAGWCMDKAEFEHFGDMKGDIIDLAMDSGNGFSPSGPLNESGVSGEVDLVGMGMRVTDDGFNFGAGVYNISKGVVCNGYMVGAGMGGDGTVSEGILGAGNATTKFYWYLDTDGNESGGCVAYGGSNSSGYEFMISYVSSNETGSIVETKKLMKCTDSDWVSTNTLITTSKQMSCGEIKGVMIALDKQGLESFSEYDKTANMRIFMASSNGSDSRTSPSDYVGPGYYTPGSIDFGFVDCSNPETKDPKCKNMQKFGFNVFEECMNGVDDNEDGLADCADPTCVFTPKCASGAAFSFVANTSDNVAPTVISNKVDELSDGAFMKIDTNEPSNMSVAFYLNDSTCSILNSTINDVGTEAYQNYSNFKPFHALDLISETTLGFALENGTAYYYKVTTCDPSGNCAVSACSNFTTKASIIDKSFIFKLDLPAGYTVDIPALNKTGYNFTETFPINGVNTTFDVGIKTNSSVTKNMNFTVHSNCDNDLSIGFYGVNVYEPVKIDMTNAFVCDSATNMMGMNSSLKKWNKLIDEMHLGGASDYIQMNIPVTYSADNTFNFVDDDGADPQDVDDYVNCASGGSGVTACKVPVSLGL